MSNQDDLMTPPGTESDEPDPLPDPPESPQPPDGLNLVLSDLLETGQVELPAELDSIPPESFASIPAVSDEETPAGLVPQGVVASQEESRVGQEPEDGLGTQEPDFEDDGFSTEEQTGEFSFESSRARQAEVGEESHIIGGRYRLREGLAMGGMGAVFKVSHLELGKDFALKIIHPGMASRTSARKSFLREAQTLSKLMHPHIVQITDFGADEMFGAYLVMEYLKGESLYARLKRDHRLPVGLALQIGLQVAEALHNMHGHELIHCDIKTENVFICRSDPPGAPVQTKLIDFGLSKNMAQGVRLSKSEIAGTPAYIAPEQARGAAPQPSMDVYAVGMLLYEMITGVLPFVGPTHKVLLDKCSSPPPAPSRHMKEPLDSAVESLIQRAMAMDPLDRQPTMVALVEDIRKVLLQLEPSSLRISATGDHTFTGPGGGLVEIDEARWSDCQIPVFRVDTKGRLGLTSEAFDRLVRRNAGAVKGLTPGSTVLGNIYQHIDADVAGAIERKSPVQRRIDFTDGDGKEASILIWLVPQTDGDGEVLGLWGTLIPVARA